MEVPNDNKILPAMNKVIGPKVVAFAPDAELVPGAVET